MPLHWNISPPVTDSRQKTYARPSPPKVPRNSGGWYTRLRLRFPCLERTIALQGGSVLEFSNWIFVQGNYASTAYEYDFRNNPSES